MTRKATITRRCFIAIEVPEAVKKSLSRAQARLKQTDLRASYVRSANIHLTLAFLGDVLMSRIHDAAGALETAVLGHRPFDVEASQLGYFGKRGSPRAIWSHIGGNEDALRALQANLKEKLIESGFPMEQRRFTPHLTIARIRIPKRNLQLVDHLENDTHQKFGLIEVRELLLLESTLLPEGPEYHILHAATLR